MRQVRSRTYYCRKVGTPVTLIEVARCETGHETTCGLLGCSHQEQCCIKAPHNGEQVYPWADCPGRSDRRIEK